MVDRPFLNSIKFQDQQWRANWDGAHPDLVQFHRAFQRRLKGLGVPMFAHEVIRTTARQQELYETGFSDAKAGEGPHPYGCAMDLVHSVQAWNLSKAEWKIIGHIGHEVAHQGGWKLRWGGTFKPIVKGVGWDPAHWEILPWRYVKKAMDDAEQTGEALHASEVVNDWRATLVRLKATIDDPSSSTSLVRQAVEQRKLIKLWLGQ